MAIFRAGKRVGPFDIRVGFPRDKSLDRVDQDPRLRQQGNSENTIGRFRSMMAKSEGYARTTRFAIRLSLPTNLADIVSPQRNPNDNRRTSEDPNAATMHQLSTEMGKQVNIHCDSISMPGVDLQTQKIQYGSAPEYDLVQARAFTGQINASFYADKYLRERQFFEMWQKMAVNRITHKANYYDNYVGKMHIYQLGSLDGEGDRDIPTYGIEATEVYPQTISQIDYNYGGNEIVKVNVRFNYKQWFNLTADHVAGMQFGKGTQTLHDIKGRSGIDGFLDRLPPEIARTGRSIFNQAKQQLPIGRLTRGKIFPPFT
tara:strand:- start:56 stop:1000 length:945 start_codon:yes stop_codon:yes gene_type:complete